MAEKIGRACWWLLCVAGAIGALTLGLLNIFMPLSPVDPVIGIGYLLCGLSCVGLVFLPPWTGRSEGRKS